MVIEWAVFGPSDEIALARIRVQQLTVLHDFVINVILAIGHMLACHLTNAVTGDVIEMLQKIPLKHAVSVFEGLHERGRKC